MTPNLKYCRQLDASPSGANDALRDRLRFANVAVKAHIIHYPLMTMRMYYVACVHRSWDFGKRSTVYRSIGGMVDRTYSGSAGTNRTRWSFHNVFLKNEIPRKAAILFFTRVFLSSVSSLDSISSCAKSSSGPCFRLGRGDSPFGQHGPRGWLGPLS